MNFTHDKEELRQEVHKTQPKPSAQDLFKKKRLKLRDQQSKSKK